jgi:hypothetical protein
VFMKQYTHRLPADYDMDRVRRRAGSLAADWDRTPGLAFKAFALQEKGLSGAPGNVYSSLYLWLDDEAAVDFITGERFASVIAAFGRPNIETWLALDLHLGRAAAARSLCREDVVLDAAVDLGSMKAQEMQRNLKLARQNDTLVAITAIDPTTWRLSRFRLSAEAVQFPETGSVYEVLHLAAPGLPALPAAG